MHLFIICIQVLSVIIDSSNIKGRVQRNIKQITQKRDESDVMIFRWNRFLLSNRLTWQFLRSKQVVIAKLFSSRLTAESWNVSSVPQLLEGNDLMTHTRRNKLTKTTLAASSYCTLVCASHNLIMSALELRLVTRSKTRWTILANSIRENPLSFSLLGCQGHQSEGDFNH